MDFFLGFQESKLKSHLKMAVHRIAIQVNKKSAAQKHAKREIATLLADMKDEKARIKVEHVIREDFTIEALGLLELLCELTHERSKYIASEKICPADLKEAIASLIWAANRVDVVELDEVKKQFTLKYGKEFSEEANSNAANTVNVRLFQKLSVTPPSAFLVIRYLEEIAREYEVEWVSTDLGLPRTNTQPPQPQAHMGGNTTSTISHDDRVIGSSSSKVAPAPMPAGGYPGSSSSGAGADMYLPMSSPVGFSIPMAPGSNLEGAYATAPSSSYNHYQQPIPIPASHNEQTPAYGMTSAPQAYQYENGPPISSFQGPSNAVPRFNGGPKVVLSDETFQMLLKGETFTSEIGGINAPRSYSVTANLEGLVRWETGGGGNQHITPFKTYEKIKIDDDHSAEGYYILTLHPKPGMQPLVLVYHTTNGYRANKWQLALTYCIDRANGRFGGGGTMAARPVDSQHTLPTQQPYPNAAIAPSNYQPSPAMQATTPQPSYPPPSYQQTYQHTSSNQPPPAPYSVASSLPVQATEIPQTAVAVHATAMAEPSPQPLPPHKDTLPPPPPAYSPPTSYTAGAAAATANSSSSSIQQPPSAPNAPASIPLHTSSSIPAPASAPQPAVKSSGDGALDDLAARFAALQKRN